MKLKRIISYLAILTMMADRYHYDFSFHWEFEFYHVVLGFILMFFLIRKLSEYHKRGIFNIFFDLKVLLLKHSIATIYFLFILFFTLINAISGNVKVFFLGKQVLGLLLHSTVFYLLIKFNNSDLKGIFKIYLNIAFVVAVIGLLHEGAFIFRYSLSIIFEGNFLPAVLKIFGDFFDVVFIIFNKFTSLHIVNFFGFSILRVNSIMREPCSFCIIMMPALFVALSSFRRNNFKFLSKKRSSVIILSFILSFSLGGYVGMIWAICLLLYKSRRFVMVALAPILILSISFYIVPGFQKRSLSLYEGLIGKRQLEQFDQSTYTLAMNSRVVGDVIKNGYFIFGRGLGSHENSYNAYLKKANITRPPKRFVYFLNRPDANSLFLRLLSETGLFGLVAFLLFIIRYYIDLNKDPTHYLWIINNSILIFFIIRLIRQGNFFSEGFFFFIWLYYFSFIQLKRLHLNENTH